jgi:hypothetical protein
VPCFPRVAVAAVQTAAPAVGGPPAARVACDGSPSPQVLASEPAFLRRPRQPKSRWAASPAEPRQSRLGAVVLRGNPRNLLRRCRRRYATPEALRTSAAPSWLILWLSCRAQRRQSPYAVLARTLATVACCACRLLNCRPRHAGAQHTGDAGVAVGSRQSSAFSCQSLLARKKPKGVPGRGRRVAGRRGRQAREAGVDWPDMLPRRSLGLTDRREAPGDGPSAAFRRQDHVAVALAAARAGPSADRPRSAPTRRCTRRDRCSRSRS